MLYSRACRGKNHRKVCSPNNYVQHKLSLTEKNQSRKSLTRGILFPTRLHGVSRKTEKSPMIFILLYNLSRFKCLVLLRLWVRLGFSSFFFFLSLLVSTQTKTWSNSSRLCCSAASLELTRNVLEQKLSLAREDWRSLKIQRSKKVHKLRVFCLMLSVEFQLTPGMEMMNMNQ